MTKEITKKPSKKEYRIATLLILFLIYLQVMDLVFTRIGLHLYGIDAEGNPIVKYLVSHLGIDFGLISVKLVAILLLMWFLTNVTRVYSRRLVVILVFLSIIYSFALYTWIVLLF